MDIRQDNNSFIRHYGLQHNPFSTASSFQFFRARRREVLEQLIHFARYSQLMLAVTGPRGSGKTVLRHAVVAASKETALNVVVSALKNSDAASIAQQLAYALQCSNADVMSLLHAVEQSVLAGKEVQLLVDDAEVLDGSALALLQRLAAGSGKTRCRVFLFGEPALQTLLQAVDSADGFEYHLVELEPWQSEEVEEYLQQRLQAAGQDLDLFTDQELGILLERGQGWPGVINQLAQELLLARMQGEQLEPASASPRRTMPALPYRHLLALLVTAFLFVFAWYQLDDSESKQPAAGPAGPAQGQAAAQPQRRVMLDIQPGEPAECAGQAGTAACQAGTCRATGARDI
jgi:DamX protein